MVTECEARPFSIGVDGVSITVKYEHALDGKMIVARPETDGYIRYLASAIQVNITIKIDFGIRVFGFSVDGNKNITPAKNYSKVCKVYRKKVPVRKNEKGEPRTLYCENHINLLEIGTGGYFAVHEGAIFFQNGLGFLTIQRVYEGFAFRQDDSVYLSCPEFDEKWPQLFKFMTGRGTVAQYRSFPEISEYTPEPEISTNTLDENVGIVKWFNLAQGFGAISTNKGDAFVHYKDIDSDDRLICLNPGQEILYEDLVLNTSGEGFPYKAIGVMAA